jgi:hypothetical protein
VPIALCTAEDGSIELQALLDHLRQGDREARRLVLERPGSAARARVRCNRRFNEDMGRFGS